jgi:hypothetical protein
MRRHLPFPALKLLLVGAAAAVVVRLGGSSSTPSASVSYSSWGGAVAFQPPKARTRQCSLLGSTGRQSLLPALPERSTGGSLSFLLIDRKRGITTTALGASPSSSPLFYNDFEDYENNSDDEDEGKEEDIRGDMKDDDDIDDEEDEDEYLNVDELGDWKELRRKLVTTTAGVSGASDGGESQSKDESVNRKQGKKVDGKSSKSSSSKSSTACKENAAMIETQCEDLAEEYRSGVWAHPTPTVRYLRFSSRRRARGRGVAYCLNMLTHIFGSSCPSSCCCLIISRRWAGSSYGCRSSRNCSTGTNTTGWAKS